jgi:hypothetical protein
MIRFCWLILLCAAAFAQPEFQASGIQPSFSKEPYPLAPGLLVTIYGNHLGPSAGCAVQPAYPTQLCDTQVLIGGIPAELLYVSEKQINLKVPQSIADGTTEIRVVYQGQSSRAVTAPLAREDVRISLEGPARVGMPVWLKVVARDWDGGIDYPFRIDPSYFGCQEVEVRRAGQMLARIKVRQEDVTSINGPGPCGSIGLPVEKPHGRRLPLHLQYRFDQPGTYEVRVTIYTPQPAVIHSQWTPIEILPANAGGRQRWLDWIGTQAPTDTANLITDYLPSILGMPDEQSLRLLLPYLYHEDTLVRQLAASALRYWPKEQVTASVSEIVKDRGPSDVTIQLADPDHVKTYVEEALPLLHSDSPVLLDGAITAVYLLALPEKPLVSDAVRARAETALLDAADHIVQTANGQTIADFACALGVAKNERARDVLWSLVYRNKAREQAMIALTWRKVPADLPKLAALLDNPPAPGKELEYDFQSLPYALHRGYGDAAIPYLETLLQRSRWVWVRTDSARELILAGRPAGFAFLVDTIEPNRLYCNEMVEFLRGQFPELRNANDATILGFVRERWNSTRCS